MAEENPWRAVNLEEGMEMDRQIGLLFFRVEMEYGELWIGYRYVEEEEASTGGANVSAPADDDLEWVRWSFSNPPEKLELQPYLPDKPMVVHSEYSQHILPGDEARIFIGIPATVRFNLQRKKEQHLLELSSEPLSRTWFGDRLEGELCYWWSTRARRYMPEMNKTQHRIGCPVTIKNSSDEELNFEKFSHRVTRLHIYRYNGGLWTDETQISYLGEEDMSEVIARGRLPKELQGAEKVTSPRDDAQRSFISRTFLGLV